MSALLLIGLLLLVMLNGFFVAAEFALVRARRAKLEKLVTTGAKGSVTALRQAEQISQYLSACQLGVTLASIGIGFLGEPAIAKLIEPLLGGLSHGAAVAISIIIAYLLVTVAHITVGEQVPKVLAIVHPEQTARRLAGPLQAFHSALRPFVSLLNKASNGILRILGVKIDKGLDEVASIEELKNWISESLAGGKLDEGEAGMLSGVFHLHEQEARQVMTPTPAVVTVDLSDTVESALQRCVSSGHTRLIVIEDGNSDRVRGLVHSNALVRKLMADGPNSQIEQLVDPAPIVPESKPLDDLLAELQRQRTTMAVVIDEYGRTAGIVTIEDIIEEVVGEIDDETDPRGGAVRRLANGDWLVRGHVAVTDLLDYDLDLPADSDAYNSVGGFVFAKLGRLPKRGDTLTADGYSLRVESVRENRVETVRIRDRRVPNTRT